MNVGSNLENNWDKLSLANAHDRYLIRKHTCNICDKHWDKKRKVIFTKLSTGDIIWWHKKGKHKIGKSCLNKGV